MAPIQGTGRRRWYWGAVWWRRTGRGGSGGRGALYRPVCSPFQRSGAADAMWPPSGSEPASEDEDERSLERPPPPEPRGAREPRLALSWLDLSAVGHRRSLAVSALPAAADLERLQALGFTAVLMVCTHAELAKQGVPELAAAYEAHGLAVCHRPVAEGEVPGPAALLQLFEAAVRALEAGGRVLLHCTTGLGRACSVAACLLLHVQEELSADQAVEAVRRLRGPRAVQSVRQFNFIHEYRDERDAFLAQLEAPESRPVSR